jgi:hypothetical protein
MALYTYEINSDWTYVEDKGLPGLWYGYKHVKFEEDTTLHTQTNYYRFSVFMKTGDIYAQYKDANYNTKTRVAIPSTIKSYRLQTYWHLPNALNGTINVEGLGDIPTSSSGSFYPYWLEGNSLTAQNAPEGFTNYTKVRYLLNDVEVVAKCSNTYGAGQFGFQIDGGEASTSSNTTDTANTYLSQFLTSGYTSSGTQEWYVNFVRSSGAIVGSVDYIYLPYQTNRRPMSISSSINLTTGEVKISFSSFPVAATGFKSWIGSVIRDYNDYNKTIGWLDDGREIPAEYFEGSSTTPFSFTLTEAERAKLFELADEYGELDESTGQIRMRISWFAYTEFYDADGESVIYVTENQTANYITLVGRPPLVEGEVYDVNEKTLALTGDKDTLIRFHSTAHFDIRGEALDAAVLQELSVSNAGGIIAGDSGEFNNVESNIFYLNAIDNRGNTSRVEVVKGWIEYVKLTANIKSNEISADGFASITISGNYYGGSFGAQDNALTLSVRYKTGDGEYGDWVSITPTIGGSNTYEHTINLEGLDYMETYTFQAKAVDKLEEILSAEKVFTTIPVFDWGHDDFNFNVPVTIQGKRMGENTILWNGSSAMIATDRAELSEPISAQMNGIVLVFSAASGDVSWNMQYVPKVMVNLLNGGGMAFMMAPNAAMGKFGAKYLYISDDVIEGDVSNETAGTGASAIKFTNADFVLRYVIGV